MTDEKKNTQNRFREITWFVSVVRLFYAFLIFSEGQLKLMTIGCGQPHILKRSG